MFHVLFHMVGVLSFNRKSKFSALARDFKEMYGKRKDAKTAPHIQNRDPHKPESLRCVIHITPVRKRSNDGSCHPKSSFSQWVFNLCCLWSQNLQRALCPCVLLKGPPTTMGGGLNRLRYPHKYKQWFEDLVFFKKQKEKKKKIPFLCSRLTIEANATSLQPAKKTIKSPKTNKDLASFG